MKKTGFSALRVCHLLTMVLFALANLGIAAALLIVTLPGLSQEMESWKDYIGVLVAAGICNALALGFGTAYLVKDYSKHAASFYKAFLVMCAVASAQYLTSVVIQLAQPLPNMVMAPLWADICRIAAMSVKIILLLVLALKKDLGARNSWIIFGILLVIDLGYALLHIVPGTLFYKLIAVLPRLLMTGTIGLAIKGKYDDKAARGTV